VSSPRGCASASRGRLPAWPRTTHSVGRARVQSQEGQGKQVSYWPRLSGRSQLTGRVNGLLEIGNDGMSTPPRLGNVSGLGRLQENLLMLRIVCSLRGTTTCTYHV
jgi:hypothetical protein